LTAPYTAPPDSPRQRHRGGVIWPLLLIFLGAVFLLQNTGYLPPNFWTNLWRLWPVILVLVGVDLLLAHHVPRIALAGLIAIVLVLGALAMNTNLPVIAGNNSQTPVTSTTAVTQVGDANQAAITVRFGAGQLNVGPLTTPGSDQLATMSYSGPPQLAPAPHYSVKNGVGQLDYATNGRPGPGFPFPGNGADSARMDIELTSSVPESLTVQTGATDAHLDLSQLRVNTLDMSIGAATAWVRFPAAAGLTTAHISGGASTLTLEIPDGVAARIQHQGGLSTLNVDESRFPKVSDNMFRSPNYDTANNKVDLTIETGVTTIRVN
jgi:LiaI-LiaF-like transmembrane region